MNEGELTPYGVVGNVTLYQGDCLEIMPKLNFTFDACITDPPYGTTACKWDSVIPFEQMWNELNRLVNGSCCIFSSQPFSSFLVCSNPDNFIEELVWLKNKNASGFGKDTRHLKIHENIDIFKCGKKYTFNPEKWLIDKKEFLTQRKTFHRTYIGNNIYSKLYDRERRKDVGERFPLSIVSCRIPFVRQNRIETYKNSVDIRFHPTQKPVSLIEYLVKTYTNENEYVLDFTSGSGTTGVACMNLNRKCVLIEKEEKYCEITMKRLQDKEKEIAERLF